MPHVSCKLSFTLHITHHMSNISLEFHATCQVYDQLNIYLLSKTFLCKTMLLAYCFVVHPCPRYYLEDISITCNMPLVSFKLSITCILPISFHLTHQVFKISLPFQATFQLSSVSLFLS